VDLGAEYSQEAGTSSENAPSNQNTEPLSLNSVDFVMPGETELDLLKNVPS